MPVKSPATRLTVSANELTAGLPEAVLEAVEARAGPETQRLAERVRGSFKRTVTSPEDWSRDDDVRQPVAVEVAQGDVRRRDAGGHGQGRANARSRSEGRS